MFFQPESPKNPPGLCRGQAPRRANAAARAAAARARGGGLLRVSDLGTMKQPRLEKSVICYGKLKSYIVIYHVVYIYIYIWCLLYLMLYVI